MDPRAILNELTAIGISQLEIAKSIGLHQSGVCRLHAGKQRKVSYSVGLALLQLHDKYAKQIRRARIAP